MKKDIISISDLNKEEILNILKITKGCKNEPPSKKLKNKSLLMIFQKPSTRTRISFEVAMKKLGGDTISLSPQELQLIRGENIKDTASVLSNYVDALLLRWMPHSEILEFRNFSTVPVINALSDLEHPTQVLTDIFTMLEEIAGDLDELRQIKISYVGEGTNVANSLALLASILGLNVSFGMPREYFMSEVIMKKVNSLSKDSGAKIDFTEDPEDAVRGSRIIYTDTWFSIAQKKEEKKIKIMMKYQVNKSLLKFADRQCKVMHCMPVKSGEEITEDVLVESWPLILKQARNKLFVAEAVLQFLIR